MEINIIDPNHQPTTAIIILAAGASTRMGTPKQLLPYQGKSLVRHIVEIAIASNHKPIIVVLGANSEQIYPQINQLPIHIVENHEWQAGMGSSIRCGVQFIKNLDSQIEAAIILLCDQPLISAEIIHQLVETYRATKVAIAVSEYARTLGVPALFNYTIFPELETIEGDRGAKHIIKNHLDKLARIPFPQGAIDLDTPEDYWRVGEWERGGVGEGGSGGKSFE